MSITREEVIWMGIKLNYRNEMSMNIWKCTKYAVLMYSKFMDEMNLLCIG